MLCIGIFDNLLLNWYRGELTMKNPEEWERYAASQFERKRLNLV